MTKEDEIKNEVAAAITNGTPEEVLPADIPALPVEAAAIAPAFVPAAPAAAYAKRGNSFGGGDRKPRGRGGRPGGRRPGFERAKPEFDQKMIDIRRVTRVVAGGRRFSFSVVLVIGDRKGSVGVGTGKAGDTSLAIEKAFRDARKNLIKLSLTNAMSIPHEVSAKYSSAEIKLMPNKGKGLVVGSSARIALDLAGVKDVTAKVLSGSKNKLNIAMATVKALGNLMPPRGAKAKKEEPVAEAKKEEK